MDAKEHFGCPKDARETARISRGLLDLVLGVLFGREFARLDVAFVQFRILLPLFRQVVQYENRGYRADWNTGATIDAFHRINVELGNTVECGTTVVVVRVLLGVDAVYGTGVNAGCVFRSDAGFGNDIGHRPPPPCQNLRYASSGEDSSVAEGRARFRSQAPFFAVLGLKADHH
jgi:hypothetical protein